LKYLLQLTICFPSIGEWAFSNRNLIIGYIHLLTLGILMPLLIGQFIRVGCLQQNATTGRLQVVYMILVILYLALLFLQPFLSLFLIAIPFYQLLLFILSLLFFFWGVGLFTKAHGKIKY
jgi:hypothetical protein